MEEKTIEELEAELKSLKKDNLERLVAVEQAKLKTAQEAEKAEEMEKQREEIRNDILEELGQQSQIVTDQKPATLENEGGSKFKVFLNDWGKNHGIDTNEDYDEWVHNHCNRFGYMEKK